MNSRTDALFLEALQIPAGAARDAFLDEACKGDAEMRQRLDALLANDTAADAFFDGPDTVATPQRALPSAGDSLRVPPSPGGIDRLAGEKPRDMIGRFKLLRIIGEGGFGTVWMAEQSEPVQRQVALKIIRIGMDTREFIARFEQERQALAMMDHPNIARVLDGGATPNGRPFFVMELVTGVPITRFCDEQKLPLAARLELFMEVCRAIQHAHQKGIIHRDIKPSNVMVTLDGDKPVPKVIDFGIAKATQGKLTDKTVITRVEHFIGTPVYMSPEQAGLDGLDVDTRADTYALGILLYELLTGKPPFDARSLAAAGYEEMRRIIREVEPPRPSSKLSTIAGDERTTLAAARHLEPAKLSRMVEPDLDWIVMKAIEKDRARRYVTVNGLALDIQRFLADEPVSAGPPGAGYKFRKFARRNKTALRVAAGIAALLVAATAVSTWQAVRATRAEKRATEKTADEKIAREDAEAVSTFLGDVFENANPWRIKDRTITVAETLETAAKKLETDLAGQPGHRAKLQAALSRTYHALGFFPEAISLREKVRKYYDDHFGHENPGTIKAMNNLAVSLHEYGSPDSRAAALKMRQEVLPLSRRVNGPEDPVTLSAMTNLASSLEDAGRQAEALKLEEEVLPLRLKVSGPEDPETLRAMSNLANTYFNAASRDKALTLREEVLSLSRTALGPRHPDTLRAMQSLAKSFAAAGWKEEALTLRREVLTLRSDVLGPDHPETIGAMHYLANSCEDTGRGDEALAMREKVVELYKTKLNPKHPETIGAMHNLAISWHGAGLMEKAIKLGEEVLALRREVDTPHHADTLAAMHSLAAFYYDFGDKDKALTMREEVVKFSKASEALGPHHPDTIAAMHNLAISIFDDPGRRKEALEMRVEVLKLSREVNRQDHPHTLEAMRCLAISLEDDGKQEEALKLRSEMDALRLASFPAARATVIPPDSRWKWLHPAKGIDPEVQAPGFHSSFFLPGFNDSAWQTGRDSAGPNGGFGYGGSFVGEDIETPAPKQRNSAYFRHQFTTAKEHTNLELRCQRDDGIIVYLDGKEVLRDNVAPGPDSWLLRAKTQIDPGNEGVTHRYPITRALAPGTHTLAISVHNFDPRSSDLRLGGVTLVEVETPKM